MFLQRNYARNIFTLRHFTGVPVRKSGLITYPFSSALSFSTSIVSSSSLSEELKSWFRFMSGS